MAYVSASRLLPSVWGYENVVVRFRGDACENCQFRSCQQTVDSSLKFSNVGKARYATEDEIEFGRAWRISRELKRED